MSSWHPMDLVSDQDLLDYEAKILDQFGATTWQTKRTKALEDWVFPRLRALNLDPYALKTRFAPSLVYGLTSGVYTDLTGKATDATEDDLNLATIIATGGSDYVYIGSPRPFRGLHLRMLDAVSSAAATLTVQYWADAWTALTVTDGTSKVSGKPGSGGGSLLWTQPGDWAPRTVNGSPALRWVRVTLSASPTGAKLTQIGCLESSALRAPATFRTLELIFREAPTSQRGGPWDEKAAYYATQAETAWSLAVPILGREFDTDSSDLVDAAEQTVTTDQLAQQTPFLLERG